MLARDTNTADGAAVRRRFEVGLAGIVATGAAARCARSSKAAGRGVQPAAFQAGVTTAQGIRVDRGFARVRLIYDVEDANGETAR